MVRISVRPIPHSTLLKTFKIVKSSAELFKQPPMQTSLAHHENEEDAPDYENLAVSAELKTLFKLINRYP